jgi:uncharacterized protein YdiU (UPF0061 family)
LLPLLADDEQQAIAQAVEVLDGFAPIFEAAFQDGLRKKLGLAAAAPEDIALGRDFLNLMAANAVDFTLAFRRLSDAAGEEAAERPVRSLFGDADGYDAWAGRWRARLANEALDLPGRRAMMRAVNPAFIPRNHRIEAVIAAAVERDDFAPFERLLAVLAKPFDDQPDRAEYRDPPQPHERVCQTFCGT